MTSRNSKNPTPVQQSESRIILEPEDRLTEDELNNVEARNDCAKRLVEIGEFENYDDARRYVDCCAHLQQGDELPPVLENYVRIHQQDRNQKRAIELQRAASFRAAAAAIRHLERLEETRDLLRKNLATEEFKLGSYQRIVAEWDHGYRHHICGVEHVDFIGVGSRQAAARFLAEYLKNTVVPQLRTELAEAEKNIEAARQTETAPSA